MSPDEESCYRNLHTCASGAVRALICTCGLDLGKCRLCRLEQAINACANATAMAGTEVADVRQEMHRETLERRIANALACVDGFHVLNSGERYLLSRVRAALTGD